MPFRFEVERQNYADFASGKVFINQPGLPAFPLRLASEIFQRSSQLLPPGGPARLSLFDPCCGGAYALSALAFFHWEHISRIQAADIDPAAVAAARRNLALLTLPGMDGRIAELERMLAAFHKPAHLEALESALRLRQRLVENLQIGPVEVQVSQADALTRPGDDDLAAAPVDLVFADTPYGNHSQWQGEAPGAAPEAGLPSAAGASRRITLMLEALLPRLKPGGIAAVVAPKDVKVAHAAFEPAGKLKHGHRLVSWVKRLSG